MNCVNHPEKDAQGACNYCGKFICPECAQELKGENYCKECFALKLSGKRAPQPSSPLVAGILSFVIAGLWQIYNGQIAKGLLIFFTSLLIFPWIYGILDAYKTAQKISKGDLSAKKRTGCVIAFAVGIFIFWMLVVIIAIIVAIFISFTA